MTPERIAEVLDSTTVEAALVGLRELKDALEQERKCGLELLEAAKEALFDNRKAPRCRLRDAIIKYAAAERGEKEEKCTT